MQLKDGFPIKNVGNDGRRGKCSEGDGEGRSLGVRGVFIFICAALVMGAGGGFAVEAASDAAGEGARGRHPNPFERAVAAPPSIQALAVTDDGTLYAGSFGFGVFRSRDRGETWTSVNAGLGDRFILCLHADGGAVYAGTVRGGVFRATDDGNAWEPMTAGLRAVEVKALLTGHGALYAGTGNGVYRFDGAARRWAVVAPGLEQTLVTSLAVTNDRRVFAGTAGRGVRRLEAAGPGAARWAPAGRPFADPKEHLPQTYIRVLAVSREQHLFAGTFDGGVFRSRDAGETWRPVGRSLPNDSIRGLVVTATALFAGTGRGIFAMTHPGRNADWAPVNDGLTVLSVQAMIGAPGGDLYAGTGAGAFRSSDAGAHWINIGDALGRYRAVPGPYF